MGKLRLNKRKCKKGRGCKFCKPHKGVWQKYMKPKYFYKLKSMFD